MLKFSKIRANLIFWANNQKKVVSLTCQFEKTIKNLQL